MGWPRWPRRRRVAVRRFDDATGRWRTTGDAAQSAPYDTLSVSTFNIWFDPFHASERYRAIADLLGAQPPDVMVFQEVTDAALAVFHAQPWIRQDYVSAAVTGRRVGTYGMLLLSRVPVAGVTHICLPSGTRRGFLRAELLAEGAPTAICSVHLDSGKRSAGLRARQLRRLFGALESDPDAVVLGDFNMRDTENQQIVPPFTDAWSALRPGDAGFTEDTAINAMRYDSTNKERFVRFDRILTKGPQWHPHAIELLGTEPISPELPRVFPSDHFGLRCLLMRDAKCP